MSRRYYTPYILSTAMLTMAAVPLQAVAQSEGERALEEVIVTAQKKTERLQDVPVSISVLDSGVLERQQVVRMQDYFTQVPGLSVSPATSGRLSIAMRGITTGGGSTNPTVGITIDDVPIGSTAGITYASSLAADIDPATLERVEALRGPQGTLYGAASLGGLLRYVTVRPKMNEFSGRVQVDGFSVNEGGDGYGVRGSANLPLIDDRLAATASGFFRHDPGIVDDPSQGRSDVDSADVYGGRLSGLWKISDTVSLRLSAMYQKTEGDGSSSIEADASLRPLNGLSHSQIVGTGSYEREIQQYDATLDVDFGWSTLTAITGYGISDFEERTDVTDFLGYLTAAATGRDDLGSMTILPSETKKFSQEIRLASSPGSKLEWLFGGFYTKEDSDVAYNIFATELDTGAIVASVFPDSFPSSFEERAVFGSATYHFTDQFDIQVGGRWGSNEQVFDELITGPLFDPPYTVHATSEDSSFTYLFSPRYRFSESTMVYGRVASGYRPGGPNPGAGFGFPAEYDADTTVSYELGMKGEFLDRRLSLDFSVYHIDWEDIQLQQRDPATEFAYFTNAGKARSRGAELTLQAAPISGLTIVATGGYSDPELTEPTNGGVIAAAGDALPYAAKWSGAVSADMEFPVTASLSGFVGGTVTYLGERFASFSSSAAVERPKLPSYTTLDLRAGVKGMDGWALSLFCRNVTDELGLLSASPEIASGATGVYIVNITRPRSFGLSVSKEF